MSIPELLPSPEKSAPEGLLAIRKLATQNIVSGAAIFGTIIFFVSAYQSIQTRNWLVLAVYAAAFITLAAIALVRNIPTNIRAMLLMTVIFVFGLIDLVQNGLAGNNRLFFLGMVTLMTMLVGPRPGFAAAGLTTLTLIGSAVNAYLTPSQGAAFPTMVWASAIASYLVMAIAIAAILTLVVNNLDRVFQKQRELAHSLELEQSSLEERINSRTTDLEKRAGQLEVASQVAHDISQETDLDALLSHSVDLIKSKFNFYHASVFIIDEAQEFAVLRASTGEAGRALLDQNHQLRVGAEGIVGYVTMRGEPRIALDVAEDAVHFKNPLLPDTRSEMAVALRAGNKIIGALDVQSVEEQAFTTEDVKILQTVADQLAVGLERASLLRKLDETIQQMETGLQLYTRQAWRSRIRKARKTLGFRARRSIVERVTDVESVKTIKKSRGKKSSVQIPLQLRGTTLGMIQVQFEGEEAPKDTVDMLHTLAERLTLALETARLLEEVQTRAEQERLVGDISARVRSSTDIQKILQTTAQELGRSLGVDEVRIQLNAATE